MRKTAIVNYRGLELEVTGDYYKGCPASRRTLGDLGDPPEPSEFSIDKITLITSDRFPGELDMSDFLDGLYHGYHNEAESCYAEIEELCLAAIEEHWYESDFEGEI